MQHSFSSPQCRPISLLPTSSLQWQHQGRRLSPTACSPSTLTPPRGWSPSRWPACSLEVIAKRSALEKTALRAFRAKYPGATTDELVRVWIDRLTGKAPSDITDALGDEVEEMATAAANKVTNYLQLGAERVHHPPRQLPRLHVLRGLVPRLLAAGPHAARDIRLAAAVFPLLLPVCIE